MTMAKRVRGRLEAIPEGNQVRLRLLRCDTSVGFLVFTLVVESTVVESVGKALASVEEALISVKQTFGPSGGGGGNGHVKTNGDATAASTVVPPTPPPVRSVRVKTESSLASVNITGMNGQHDLSSL